MPQQTCYSADFLFLCATLFVVSFLALLQAAGCRSEELGASPSADEEWAEAQLDRIAKGIQKAYQAQAKQFDMHKAEEIVNVIRTGDLEVGARGEVHLPADTASLTCDGYVYVTARNDEPSAYLFPMWIGKGSNLIGYLYLSDSQDGTAHPELTKGEALRLVLPVTGGEPKRGDAEVVDQISPNWYRVSRGID